MEKKTLIGNSGRRKFLKGFFAGAGVVGVAALTRGKAQAKPEAGESEGTGPVLYRRTAEAERYYKTLYT